MSRLRKLLFGRIGVRVFVVAVGAMLLFRQLEPSLADWAYETFSLEFEEGPDVGDYEEELVRLVAPEAEAGPLTEGATSRLAELGLALQQDGAAFFVMDRTGGVHYRSTDLQVADEEELTPSTYVQLTVDGEHVGMAYTSVRPFPGEGAPAGEAISWRFAREVALSAGVVHENLVPVHDSGTLDDGRPFVALAFANRGNLRKLLRASLRLPVFLGLLRPKGLLHEVLGRLGLRGTRSQPGHTARGTGDGGVCGPVVERRLLVWVECELLELLDVEIPQLVAPHADPLQARGYPPSPRTAPPPPHRPPIPFHHRNDAFTPRRATRDATVSAMLLSSHSCALALCCCGCGGVC